MAFAAQFASGVAPPEKRRWRLLAAASPSDEGGFSPEELAAAEAELAALEDDLEGLEDEFEAQAEARVDSILAASSLPTGGPSVVPGSGGASAGRIDFRVAVCGIEGAGPGEVLLARLAGEATPSNAPRWVDLRAASKLSFEALDEMLAGCQAMVVCPDPADSSSQILEVVKAGLKAVLASSPYELTRVWLVSHVGAQASKGGWNISSFFGEGRGVTWDNIEDELTSTARTRTSSRPLRVAIVRAGDAPQGGAAHRAVRCFPVDTPPAAEGAVTSSETLAEALFQSVALAVNSSFCLVEEPVLDGRKDDPDWSELLLPFIGPEVWRIEVPDARRAAIFVQSWADEFFGSSKNALRLGIKTPVQIRRTPAGVIFKFRPLNTEKEASFDDLLEGGLEFIAEEPKLGPPRLRARRVAYGWKVPVKENSEKGLLDKFAKDWAEVSDK